MNVVSMSKKNTDILYGSGLLGESLAPSKNGALSERFQIPPFTVLSAREGWWAERKRAWIALGIQSELGRGENSAPASHHTAPPIGEIPVVPQPPSAAQKATRPRVIVEKPVAARPATNPNAPVIQTTAFGLPESNWRPTAELPSLSAVRQLSIDVETCDPNLSDLGPGVRRGGYMAGIAVALDINGPRMYLPFKHQGGDNLPPEVVLNWARDEFPKFTGEVVGASLLYDLDYMAHEGIEFKNASAFHDVQIIEVLLNEWRYSYELDAISKDRLGVGKDESLLRAAAAAHNWTTDDRVKANIWRLPARYVGPYAEGDVDRPIRMLPQQLAQLADQQLEQVYEIERKLIPILLGMRRRGVRVNIPRAEEVRKILETKEHEQLDILRSFAGPKAGFMAVDSFSDALKDRGLPLEYTPKKGAISVKSAWLQRHKNDPMISSILLGRKFFNAKNTFIDGHVFTHSLRKPGDNFGRIHCEFNQLKNAEGRGTAARFSSSNPNLQNVISRDDEFITENLDDELLSYLVRSIFVPEDEHLWQRDDASQIEYRLLVHFARGRGSDEARARYNNDPSTDYHKFCAELAGISPDDKILRKRVKGINFAKGYGAKRKKLAELLNCTLEEADDFIKLYETALPFTVDTFNAAENWAKRRGFIVTVLNRRHRFPFWQPTGSFGKDAPPGLPKEKALIEYGENIQRANAYKALNNKLQGSAADIMKKGMVDAYEAGIFAEDALGFPMVTVHDELGSSVSPTGRGDEAGRELPRVLERAVKLRVPVIVESARGKTWGDCK